MREDSRELDYPLARLEDVPLDPMRVQYFKLLLGREPTRIDLEDLIFGRLQTIIPSVARTKILAPLRAWAASALHGHPPKQQEPGKATILRPNFR